MSIAKTFTVTMTGSSPNHKYVIDGVQQPTIMMGKGLTYRFDVSDSSNTDTALRFSTTSDGTHAGGTIYSTGWFQNLGGGNPGAYVQMEVAPDAPSPLYYFELNEANAGGQANTDGWGRSMWGQADWGDTNIVVQGWGRLGWGSQAYGDAPVVALSGLSATTSVGTPEVEIRPGWGTLNWGENGWGSVDEGIENLIGIGATSSVGSTTIEIGVPLTGVSATASCPTQLDIPQLLTGVSATVSEGQLNINNGSDHVQGLASLVGTSSVGTILPADVIGISGVSATVSVGPDLVITDTVVTVLGSAGVGTTGVGIILPADVVGISGVSATSAVGSITPAEVMGLIGVSATVTVGNVSPLGYGDVDITGNTSYSDVNKTNSASYSDVDVTGETSYTDVTHAA